MLAEANKRGCLIDEVLKASDIKYEDGKIKLQAGNEVVAETPVFTADVHAEIKGDFNQGSSEKQKTAERLAFQILETVTGKNQKYLKMILKNNSEAKAKQREKLYELAMNASDELIINALSPEYLEYFAGAAKLVYNENNDADHTDASNIVEQALDIIENGYTDPEQLIDKRYQDFEQAQNEYLNEIKTKFDNAQSIEELNAMLDDVEKNTPKEFVTQEFADEVIKSWAQNSERLENGRRFVSQDISRTEGEISEYDPRTTQKSLSYGIRTSDEKTAGKTQETRLNVYYQTGNKEIDESKLYNSLPQDLKEAVDYIFNGEPVYNVSGNEFPNNGENLNERINKYYKDNFDNKLEVAGVGEIKLDKKILPMWAIFYALLQNAKFMYKCGSKICCWGRNPNQRAKITICQALPDLRSTIFVAVKVRINAPYGYSKSNKSLTFTPKLSAIIFNFVIVTSVAAISKRLIIEREMPSTPISSWVNFFASLIFFKFFPKSNK